MAKVQVTQQQRTILNQAYFFYLAAGSFHSAQVISNILSRGFFRSSLQRTLVACALQKIVNPSLVNNHFTSTTIIKGV